MRGWKTGSYGYHQRSWPGSTLCRLGAAILTVEHKTSKTVSRTTKIRMYKTTIRPVVLCGSETWCLTANGGKNLRIWERNVLRKIFGPICVVGYWRSRTNEEVRQLYGELDIVTEIKKED